MQIIFLFFAIFHCLNDCQVSAIIDKCLLPKDRGPCLPIVPIFRWFHNAKTGKCEEFGYGGCYGNDNNFKSLKECESECIGNVCTLPVEPGPCRGSFPRYYFDKSTGRCETFIYGGCHGNANRFSKLEDCEKKCVCDFPLDRGPCDGVFPRFYYNRYSGACLPFNYGGCGGNINNFEMLSHCKRVCGETEEPKNVCELPKDSGPCVAFVPRFFFNVATGACEPFVYGGCQGNGNNFETMEECLHKCGPCDICQLDHDKGSCRGYFPRYYYDATSGECKYFIYGGCQGNGNRFLSIEQCQERCGKREDDIPGFCFLPSETGPCLAYFERFYYDINDQMCKKFVYGGCQGNQNNFATIAECMAKCDHAVYEYCSSEEDIKPKFCQEKPETGRCKAAIPRYYYDPTSNECKKFIYGGCGGNNNNFQSYEDCMEICGDPDNDKDGIPDSKDPDDDNDGIPDDKDPRPFDFDVDTDGDGIVDFFDPDDDDDGIPDGKDPRPKQFDIDTDGDGLVDYVDPDDDNDGVPDEKDPDPRDPDVPNKTKPGFCNEAPDSGDCGNTDPKISLHFFYDPDSNECHQFPYSGCGGNKNNFETFADCMETCSDPDNDKDGIPDSKDPDDDNDGIPDDKDPRPFDFDVDTDGDGIVDFFDPDDDNDGIPDGKDPRPKQFDIDTDGDGLVDYVDPDDDNDGIPDSDDPRPFDPDVDTDGDGVVDFLDDDDDGDGIPDVDDPYPLDPTKPGPDTDGDGIPDSQDDDDDNDGIPDVNDPYPLDPRKPGPDTDGDGIPDSQDDDDDNDGIPDVDDPYPLDPRKPGPDTDGDGIPDSQDDDDDNDGIPDVFDPYPLDPTKPGPDADTDGDGIPDFADPDPFDPNIPDPYDYGNIIDKQNDEIIDVNDFGGYDGNGDADTGAIPPV